MASIFSAGHWLRRVLVAILFAATLVAFAAPSAGGRKVSAEVTRTYNSAQGLLEEGKPGEALKLVRKQLRSGVLTQTERAVLLRFAAQLEVELENYRQAIRDIEASFKTAVLTDVRAIAEEALEAAEAAFNTGSEDVRQAKLNEYERAREYALRRLNAGAREEARKDRAAAEELFAQTAKRDLSPDEIKLVNRLDETTRRRIEALEEAQADLEKAAKIAAQARGSAPAGQPSSQQEK